MAWYDGPKERDHPDVTAYIADLEEPQRRIVEAVRAIVHEDPGVVEGIAWGVPFWFRNGPLCYTSAAKHHVTLGIARGLEVHDKHGRLTGTGKSPIRKTIVKLREEFPEAAFRDWLAQATVLDEAGD